MKLRGGKSLKMDWQRTLTFGAVILALAYGVVDRTIYAKAVKERELVRAQAVEAWGQLFTAQEHAAQALHVPRRAWDDQYALTRDPVLSTYDVLRQLAAWTRVRITVFTPTPPMKVEETMQTPIAVTVVGAYPEIVRFLTRIEHSSLLFSVQSTSINRSDQPGVGITGQVSLVVTTLPGALKVAPDSTTASAPRAGGRAS
jgi:hypothetical protein